MNYPVLNVFIGMSGYFFEFFPIFDARFSRICIWCSEDFLPWFIELNFDIFCHCLKWVKTALKQPQTRKKFEKYCLFKYSCYLCRDKSAFGWLCCVCDIVNCIYKLFIRKRKKDLSVEFYVLSTLSILFLVLWTKKSKICSLLEPLFWASQA